MFSRLKFRGALKSKGTPNKGGLKDRLFEAYAGNAHPGLCPQNDDWPRRSLLLNSLRIALHYHRTVEPSEIQASDGSLLRVLLFRAGLPGGNPRAPWRSEFWS